MRITVVGTGYVGLVSGTCLAESGNDVFCVDKDAKKIAMLLEGRIPIYEPGLRELVERNVKEGRLTFGTSVAQGLGQAQLAFICVGTPQGDDGAADLASIWAVGDALADAVKSLPTKREMPLLVIVKSTVPVGTNGKLLERITARVRQGIEVASNPEFLKEGAAIDDFMKPDRVVVGVRSAEAENLLRELYAPFLRTDKPFLAMSPESAEMTKYVANAMLATKISFINEMANLCEKLGADVNDVRRGIGHDERIGFQFLFPGVGWGGSCFPKDVQAIIAMGKQAKTPMTLMQSVCDVNEAQKRVLLTKIRTHYGAELKDKTLAMWGLAFKPRTDDVREAPALVIIKELLKEGVRLQVHDPEAIENVRGIFGDKLTYVAKPYGALEDADGLVIVTEWQHFRNPDFDLMKRLLNQPVIFDGRNLYEPKAVAAHGFKYYAIGRRT